MATSETVSIHILDKEYQVNCPPEEKSALLDAARQLDERMEAIRNSGTVIGLERIAVMAALNLVYDLQKSQENSSEKAALSKAVLRMNEKLSDALQGLEQTSAF